MIAEGSSLLVTILIVVLVIAVVLWLLRRT